MYAVNECGRIKSRSETVDWRSRPARLRVMGWASHYIGKLKAGETVSFRPRGHSMTGRIESGQLCTVKPVAPAELNVDDIVLCTVRGTHYLHLVKAIQGRRYQIGNNRGRINGWIGPNAIFGRLVSVED